METQSGWQLRPEEFRLGFEKFDDLVYYDGPLLSHYTSPGGRSPHYLFSCVSQDESHDRWLVIEVTVPHLYDYLTNARSLRDIIEQDYNHKVYVADADANGDFEKVLLVPRVDLLPSYLPRGSSFYGLAMSKEYEHFFATVNPVSYADRLLWLREKKVSFRLKPIEHTYATTVGANDIGSFLQKVTRSFKSYLAFRFEKVIKPTIESVEYASQVLDRLLEFSEPRAVFAGYNSFEIDLAIDVLPLDDVEVKYVRWQENTLQAFKHDVFDFDFEAENMPESLEGANEEQLRSMLLPIVQIATNKNYLVETRDAQEPSFKILKRVTKIQANRVVPLTKNKEEELIVPTKLVNFLLELTEGQDITDMSKNEIRKALISVKEADSSTVSGFNSAEGKVIEFAVPIEVNLSRVDNFYQAEYEPLGITTTGANGRAAMDGFRRELSRLYSQYLRNVEDRKDGREGLRSARMGQILDEFGELLQHNS